MQDTLSSRARAKISCTLHIINRNSTLMIKNVANFNIKPPCLLLAETPLPDVCIFSDYYIFTLRTMDDEDLSAKLNITILKLPFVADDEYLE